MTTINKWDQGGSRLPFLARLFFKQFVGFKRLEWVALFILGILKSAILGLLFSDELLLFLGLFATVTPKSVHESV